jgi:hypothetical protein
MEDYLNLTENKNSFYYFQIDNFVWALSQHFHQSLKARFSRKKYFSKERRIVIDHNIV